MTTSGVSIVLPTRNRVGSLRRAIETVRAQTFRDWELIVVDDASADDTAAMLQQIVAADARVRTIRMATAAGAARARNRAIEAARGEFVAFIDDDDEWLPAKLERQVSAMRVAPESVGVCCTHFMEVDAHGSSQLFGGSAGAGGDLRRRLRRGNVLGLSTTVVRRIVLTAAGGFNERLPRLQDWDLWLRLSRVTQFLVLPVPLARIHRTAGSISQQPEALRVATAILHENAMNDDGISRAERADMSHALGQLLVANGFSAAGRSLVLDALRYPWPPSRVLTDALLLLGRGPYGAALRVRDALAARRAATHMRREAT